MEVSPVDDSEDRQDSDDSAADIRVEPATSERWADVLRLAGERGFTSGCWCMWWRVTNQQFTDQPAEDRRTALEALVQDGAQPGLVAYVGDEPVGWVAVAPRGEYPRLDRSRKLKPVDDQPVWSIPCFYIDRRHRRRGVAARLLDAAVAHARAQGAQMVEAYPIDVENPGSKSSAELYTGTLPLFERAGFDEVVRREGRPIVRREV